MNVGLTLQLGEYVLMETMMHECGEEETEVVVIGQTYAAAKNYVRENGQYDPGQYVMSIDQSIIFIAVIPNHYYCSEISPS